MNTWAGLPGAANFLDAVLGSGDDGTAADAAAGGRFAYARDAAVTSYRNRLGRPPSEAELLDSMPHFMTREDREAYAEAQAGRSPIQARGFSLRPPARRAPPPPYRPSPAVPPAALGLDGTPSTGTHPYLDAAFKTGLAAALVPAEPILRAADLAWRLLKPESAPDVGPATVQKKARENALRAQVAAYDRYKSDPRKSYQTYTKERMDTGPCLYSDKPDPDTPCYYAGWTGNIFNPADNVEIRDAAQYPYPIYHAAKLDCSTRSWVAARAREQQLIEHFRGLGYSDNVINSIADHLWRPYMKELANRECGHNAMPIPSPR